MASEVRPLTARNAERIAAGKCRVQFRGCPDPDLTLPHRRKYDCDWCADKDNAERKIRTARRRGNTLISRATPIPVGRRSGRSTVRAHTQNHTHDLLLRAYAVRYGIDLETSSLRFENGTVCDLVHHEKQLLIEVKPNGTRSEIQKGLGELDDYIRFFPNSEAPYTPQRAFLVSEQLSDDLEALCKSREIIILVQEMC